MRSSILLSGKRDPDLIALYKKVGGTEFSNLLKDALRMIVREGYKGKTSPPNGLLLQADPNEETMRINLVLTSEKDEDVRELLSHVLPGKRGLFIKMALRFYLGPAAVFSGLMDSDFTGKLHNNPVQVQIFAIEGIKTKKQKSKRRAPRKPQTSRPVKTVSANTAEQQSAFFSTENTQQAPCKNENETAIADACTSPVCTESTGNEDDEMLALLEGLL